MQQRSHEGRWHFYKWYLINRRYQSTTPHKTHPSLKICEAYFGGFCQAEALHKCLSLKRESRELYLHDFLRKLKLCDSVVMFNLWSGTSDPPSLLLLPSVLPIPTHVLCACSIVSVFSIFFLKNPLDNPLSTSVSTVIPHIPALGLLRLPYRPCSIYSWFSLISSCDSIYLLKTNTVLGCDIVLIAILSLDTSTQTHFGVLETAANMAFR